uniref:DnaJ homolog subfamily C member 17 n=1 Tax=Ornithodoros turicata TaxID=34597 RepID=A0A2R5LDQ6_9ACAR
MDALMKVNLYELLQISSNADEKEIKSAYRKKALTCHPDKNPDNPRAAELFQELSRALEILTDTEARAAYDKVLKAREAAKVRNRELDAKRRKLKEDLEAREQQALNNKIDEIDAAKQFEKEIERLRKEGSKKLEEERELLRKQIEEELGKRSEPVQWQPRLKLKWKAQKGAADEYDEESLRKTFSKYGHITCLIVSAKKKGSALVEYETVAAANLAIKMEQGRPECPIIVSWVQEPPPPASTARVSAAKFPVASVDISDYESAILAKMRRAQEKKTLSENIAGDDT